MYVEESKNYSRNKYLPKNVMTIAQTTRFPNYTDSNYLNYLKRKINGNERVIEIRVEPF